MAVMDSTLYLPGEVLSFRNYPEVFDMITNIQGIIAYATEVNTALASYTSNTLDRIDINLADLQKYITLCRSTCATLGNAPLVCFDILVELRDIQDILQTFVFVSNRYGGQYIGTPTNGGAS